MFFTLSQAEAGHGCPISRTYAAVPAVVLCVTVLACLSPARRAARLDPVVALAGR